MFNVFFTCIACTFSVGFALDYLEGWNYINLHCRDDSNKPVDWWYIYKPPSDTVPYFERGYNFTYITPDTVGRWQTSRKHINSNSMLQNTISPIFRQTYSDHLAVLSYDMRGLDYNEESATIFGMMMADEIGGLWIGHTVPGLLDLDRERPIIPEEETDYGHMLMCMSLDLITLNRFASTLSKVRPKITRIHIPDGVRDVLPEWVELASSSQKSLRNGKRLRPQLEFYTKREELHAFMLTRPPGSSECLYQKFARSKHLVLDVYGHRNHEKPVCTKQYSVRFIDSISLKSDEQVYYITNTTDRAVFAVSTAAHWQRTVSGPRYWTCLSGPDKGTASGSLLMCVQNYNVWLSFDNLKVKEPEC